MVQRDPLSLERLMTGPGLISVVIVFLSGVFIYIAGEHSIARQLMILVHIIIGLGLVFLCILYIPIHFSRTAFFRRPTLILTGIVLVLVLIGLIVTGIHPLVLGSREVNPLMMPVHVLVTLVFTLFLPGHVLDHYYRMSDRRKDQYISRFLTFDGTEPRMALYSIAVLIVVVGTPQLVFENHGHPQPVSPAVDDYALPYGNHPFRPSQTETTHGSFVTKAQIGKSEDCIGCHLDISNQWMISVHRQAANDPTYITNVRLLEGVKGISSTRYCEGCHAPVALLTGELSPGGIHGGIEGSMANNEGVSCMACHGVNEMVHLKGVASYQFKPREEYLFENSENRFLKAINHLLIRVDPDQHIKDLANPLLAEPEFCAGCHAQFMDKDVNEWGWVKMQDEYSAWLNSPYSRHEDEFTDEEPILCRDCHMPLIDADDPSADVNGKVRSHFFYGANTFLPLLYGDKEQFDGVRKFLQANNIRLTFDKPNRDDSRQDLRSLDETIRGSTEAPFYAYLGETVNINLIVTNQGVGHDFPGGSIDLGEAWINFVVMDAQGSVISESGTLDENLNLSADAHVYKSILVSREGREVWKHDLFNMVGESFRRVIRAGESDLVRYEFRVPGWAKSPLSVTATLRYRKVNERYARFALGEHYIPIPVVDMGWDSIQIPLRIRTEVDPTEQATKFITKGGGL